MALFYHNSVTFSYNKRNRAALGYQRTCFIIIVSIRHMYLVNDISYYRSQRISIDVQINF